MAIPCLEPNLIVGWMEDSLVKNLPLALRVKSRKIPFAALQPALFHELRDEAMHDPVALRIVRNV